MEWADGACLRDRGVGGHFVGVSNGSQREKIQKRGEYIDQKLYFKLTKE